MGFSRINIFALLRDQYRFMVRVGSARAAVLPRVLVIAMGPLGFAAAMIFRWQMVSASDLVGALGLMAGVFLSAFAVIFSLRVNLDARPTRVLQQGQARLMDEGALTVLAAGLLSGVDAAWLAVVTATTPSNEQVTVWATAITVGLSALVGLYFLLSIRRLHVLYTDKFPPFFKVKDTVDGNKSRTLQDGPKG